MAAAGRQECDHPRSRTPGSARQGLTARPPTRRTAPILDLWCPIRDVWLPFAPDRTPRSTRESGSEAARARRRPDVSRRASRSLPGGDGGAHPVGAPDAHPEHNCRSPITVLCGHQTGIAGPTGRARRGGGGGARTVPDGRPRARRAAARPGRPVPGAVPDRRLGYREPAGLGTQPGGPGTPPRYEVDDLLGLGSADAREILARVLDGSELDEFQPRHGAGLVAGWGELHGYPVGVLAMMRYGEAETVKAAEFVRRAGNPLVFLDNGVATDPRLVEAVATSPVPHLRVELAAGT